MKTRTESLGCLTILFSLVMILGTAWRYYRTQGLLKNPKFVVGRVTFTESKGKIHYEYEAHDAQTYSGSNYKHRMEVGNPVLVVYDSLNPNFSNTIKIPVWDLEYSTQMDSVYNKDALDTLPISWY